MKFTHAVVSMVIMVGASACIRAPDIVIVDRRTALEEQATGRLPALEGELRRATLAPGPKPYTRGELLRSGWTPAADKNVIARLYRQATTDKERIDALLRRRCVGESLGGTLVVTRESCKGEVNLAPVSRLLEHANRNRRQIWLYLQTLKPRSSLDDIRRQWRQEHLTSVLCGGHIQRPSGAWTEKKC